MNSFIWRKKNITGGSADTSNLVTLNSAQTISGVKTFSALPQSSVAPTNNNDLVNKSYADGAKNGNNWTTINNISNIGTLNDTWTRITDYTNNQNGFSVEGGGTYEVLFKCNTNSTDIYCSCILAVNNANYDNCGFSSPMYWGGTEQDSIQFAIYLKNGQFKLYAKRHSGSNTSWNTGTRIYVRKIAQGNIA